MDPSDYLILIEGGPPSNFSAWSPDVPGCVSTGRTVEEIVANMRQALAAHVGLMLEAGEAVPEATGPGVYLDVATSAA